MLKRDDDAAIELITFAMDAQNSFPQKPKSFGLVLVLKRGIILQLDFIPLLPKPNSGIQKVLMPMVMFYFDVGKHAIQPNYQGIGVPEM